MAGTGAPVLTLAQPEPRSFRMLEQRIVAMLKGTGHEQQGQDAEDVSHLAKGRWPLLEWLDLSHNKFIDANVFTELSKADWPKLRTLKVSFLV